MRNVTALALVFTVVACGGDPPPPPANPTPPPVVTTTPPPAPTAETPPPAPKKSLPELQQAAGKAMGEAIVAGDAAAYAALFTEDATVKTPGQPDAVGREAIKTQMAGWNAAFTKGKMGEQRVFVKGEVVVSEWVLTGTNSGDFKGFKASEKPVGVQGASIMWFTPAGLIKEEHVYLNASTVMTQAGLSKDKGRAVVALPSGAPEVVISKDAPEEKANTELFEKINKGWEAKKADDVAAVFSDDATWDDLTLPAPSKGKKDIKKYISTFITAVPDAKLATTHIWGFGDWVVEEGTYGGTQKGNMFGLPPTNKAFTIHELTIAKVSGGKITQAVSYGNDLEMLAQVDPKSLPKPPAAKPDAKPAGTAKPAAPAAPKK